MISEIKALEKIASSLDFDKEERRGVTRQFFDYAHRFLTGLPADSAFEGGDDPAHALDAFQMKEKGRSGEEVLSMIDKAVTRPGINMASGSDLAYIPGGGLYASALADYLSAVTNKYATVYSVSPGAARMENILIRWLCDLIGYDRKSFGHLSSGGSMANLTAVIAARDAKKMLQDPEKKVIYFTHQVHHCLLKALHIAGLDKCKQQLVPMNTAFQMDVEALQALVRQHIKEGNEPALVVASAGTTDIGAIDDLAAVATVAESHEMWYHVDGAYGGFFLLTDEGKKAMKGISRADSVVMDPHKGLFLPYGSGAVLLKEGHYLFESFYVEANYLQDTQMPIDPIKNDMEISPSDISPELSRHFRGLRMWVPLQLHGLEAFSAALEEKLLLTRYFHREIQKADFESGPDPQLSVSIFRYVPDTVKGDLEQENRYNRELMHAIQNEKKIFISSTTIDGVYWLRLAVLSFRTHLKHIDILLSSLKEKTGHSGMP